MKIYVREIEDPDYDYIFTDYYQLELEENERPSVFGNSRFNDLLTDEVKTVLSNLDSYSFTSSIYDILETCETENICSEIQDLIRQFFEGERFKTEFNNEELRKFAYLVTVYDDNYMSDEKGRWSFTKIMEILTDIQWECAEIHGCCQGEWNYMFYPTKYWYGGSLEDFEARYFNTGTLYEVCKSSKKITDPEEIDGDYHYFAYPTPSALMQELAALYDVSLDDIVLL